MITADLIVEARRRAGLTQEQLAERLGKPRPTVARWESGRHVPSMETVRAIADACGLELTYGLANADDSYVSLIERQLALTPGERLDDWSQRSAGVFSTETSVDARAILRALAAHDVDHVLVGQLAGGLQGSPIAGGRHVEVVPASREANRGSLVDALAQLHADERPGDDADITTHPWTPWRLPDGSHLIISPRPAATHGYEDLARDSVILELGDSLEVRVASLRDLARIADATPRREQAELTALRTTLACVRYGIPKGEIPAPAWATLDEHAVVA